MVFFVSRLADLILPWAARHATVWPSTHAQHGALLNGMAELEAENRRLRGAVGQEDYDRVSRALDQRNIEVERLRCELHHAGERIREEARRADAAERSRGAVSADVRDLENAAELLEQADEEYVNPPTAQANREAAMDLRRISNQLRGAVSADDARRWQTALRAMLDKHGCECGVCVEAQQALPSSDELTDTQRGAVDREAGA